MADLTLSCKVKYSESISKVPNPITGIFTELFNTIKFFYSVILESILKIYFTNEIILFVKKINYFLFIYKFL